MAEKKMMKVVLRRSISDRGQRYERGPNVYEFDEKLALYLIDVQKAYPADSKEAQEFIQVFKRQADQATAEKAKGDGKK